ncbi:collagenase 3-like [Engraulis encrasicolus]|uniref:collagenase 3-like n=1 Tax=Engraulis encrasicolus TaxID=184585 RepID=UPI002FD3AFCC
MEPRVVSLPLLLLLLGALKESAPVSISMPETGTEAEASEAHKTFAEEYIDLYFSDVTSLNSLVMRSVTNYTFEENLEMMQSFFGLEVTGKLHNDIIQVMKAPRCGVSDISRYGHFRGQPKWEKKLITYRITQYTPDLTRRQVDDTIAHAFKLYSDVIPLDFKQITSGTADIMILFKGGYHGDFYPFDGRGGVLANANSLDDTGGGVGGLTVALHFDSV